MRSLNNRYCVSLVDYEQSSNFKYLIMEKCDGGSLSQYMRHSGGKLPIKRCVELYL